MSFEALPQLTMPGTGAYAKGPPLSPLGEGEPRTLVAALRRAATTLPVRGITFVSADDSLGRLLSYAQLLEGATLRLGAFQAMGIRQGEPLLMQVSDLHDHILALWGCLLGGIAPVNIASPPKYEASQHSQSAPSGLHPCDTSFEGSWLLCIAGRSIIAIRMAWVSDPPIALQCLLL